MHDKRVTTLLSFSFPNRLQPLPLVGARPEGPRNSAGVVAASGLAMARSGKKAALHVDQGDGWTPGTLELKREAAPLPRDIWLKHVKVSWRSSSHYTSIFAHRKLDLWRAKDDVAWPRLALFIEVTLLSVRASLFLLCTRSCYSPDCLALLLR